MKNASFRGRGGPPGSFTAGSLEFQQSLIRGILSASPDGILVVDEHDVVVSVNRRFFQAWGMPMERVPGGRAELVVGTSDQPILAMAVERVQDSALFLQRVKELYDNPQLDDHCEIKLKDGRTLERHSTVLRGAGEEYLGRVWFFRDVTRRKRTEATLRDLAAHDPLTGVSNRRHFFTLAHKEFARAWRYSTPLSVIVIDLDHFKEINDRYGHAGGDEVLKAVCVSCRQVLRDFDLFARMGGEEFAALLPNTDLEETERTAERLRQRVMEQHVTIAAEKITCTVSIGASALTSADEGVEVILNRADAALYRAKKNGRNCVKIER